MFNTSKRISYSLISLSLISIIASCSSSNLPITATTSVKASSDFSNSNLGDVKLQQLIQANSTKGETVTVLDAGNGQKTSASFALKINFGAGVFKTKVSVAGTAGKKFSDVTKLDIFLIESASAPTGNISGLITVPNSFLNFPITYASSGDTKLITFKNVKANTGSNRYYVAVAAKGSAGNITNLTAPANNGSPTSPLYVTNLANSVSVTAGTYAIDNTVALSMSLFLADAVGATVESQVSVSNGSAIDLIATTAS